MKNKYMAPKKKRSHKKAIGIGTAVVATAAAAAAGAYLLYGSKQATKNRKIVKSWMGDAKREVMGQIRKAKSALSRADYEKMVDQAMRKYHKLSSASVSEVNKVARDIKREWKKFVKTSPAGRSSAKRKKVARKKVTKKSSRRR